MNKNSNNMMIGAVLAVVVFSGASFYGGMKYEASKSTAANAGAFAQSRTARFGQGSTTGAGARTAGATRTGGPVLGSIVSKDATSLTIKLASGGSQIAFYDASTTVMKTSPSTVSDLTIGDQVMVNGTQNSDGSISAQSVQSGVDANRFRGAQSQQGQNFSPTTN